MNLTHLYKVVCVSCLLFSGALCATSSVWQVNHGGQKLYIGGTVHQLPASEFPLPAEFDKAYQQAKKLVFEVELSQMAAPGYDLLFMSHAKYQDGRTLSSVLSPENYQHLQQVATGFGIDITGFEQFKPDYILMSIMQSKLQQLGMAGDGVDMYFYNKGSQDGKSKDFLETTEQQLAILLSISDGFENDLVAEKLAKLDDTEQVVKQVLTAWRSGNSEALTTLSADMLNTEVGQREYQRVLTERNNNWVEQLEAMLQTTETEFVLVGVMHLAGPGNVLDLLAERGYQVQQLSAK